MPISVIIPAYGHAEFLLESITSVLVSSPEVVGQLVVVADGDRECYGVSKAVDDVRVLSLLLESNNGSYIAQNTGIRHASCDWITFVGADDILAPRRLERMLELAESVGPKAVVNSWHKKLFEGGTLGKMNTEALGGVFMYHRSMLAELGGFRAWPCTADSDLYWRAMRNRGRRAVVMRPLYLYRQHGDQLTKREDTAFGSDARKRYELMARGSKEIFVEAATGAIEEQTPAQQGVV